VRKEVSGERLERQFTGQKTHTMPKVSSIESAMHTNLFLCFFGFVPASGEGNAKGRYVWVCDCFGQWAKNFLTLLHLFAV